MYKKIRYMYLNVYLGNSNTSLMHKRTRVVIIDLLFFILLYTFSEPNDSKFVKTVILNCLNKLSNALKSIRIETN